MNSIDVIIAVILLFGLFRGLMKGLFVEITSLVGLILGVYGALHFSHFLANILKSRLTWDESMIQIVAFAGTFFAILLGLAFLGKGLTKIAETASLGIFNKILGAVFGILKYALILSVVFLVYDQINSSISFLKKEEAKESVLFEPIKNLAPTIFPKLIKVVEKPNQK
ncbi:MAG: CvpA family protein [Flavobacteriaceae bacterium]|nr:CvpA family protein [Flavobacteriaceae bacterium]